MKILVKNKDLGFFTQEEITVQRLEFNGEDNYDLVWCSHDGAEVQEVENSMVRIDAPDVVWYTEVLVCDKCNAYMLPDGRWEDAPIEGAR